MRLLLHHAMSLDYPQGSTSLMTMMTPSIATLSCDGNQKEVKEANDIEAEDKSERG